MQTCSNNDIMDMDIEVDIDTYYYSDNESNDSIKEEYNIILQYVDIKHLKILRRLYNTQKKSYFKILIELAQYTNNYNEYIINFLERNPSQVIVFQELLFSELLFFKNIDQMSFELFDISAKKIFNDNLIIKFISKYSNLMANYLNSKGQNLLMLFCSNLFSDIITDSMNYIYYLSSLLISIGINVFQIDQNNNTILHIICRNITKDYHNRVNNLIYHITNLSQNRIHEIINKQNKFGYTPLDYAIISNNHMLVKMLLQYGANLTQYGNDVLKNNVILRDVIDRFQMDKLINNMNCCNIQY